MYWGLVGKEVLAELYAVGHAIMRCTNLPHQANSSPGRPVAGLGA
jgi:hypothetical protein